MKKHSDGKKERPLPRPPKTPFGRPNPGEQSSEPGELVADRMAAAAAEGKLDEFLKKEMPDNEYARNLASMMMGMTGMMPGMGMSPAPEKQEEPSAEAEEISLDEVPDDVRAAIMGGDVQSLMSLLRREHEKRNPDSPLGTPEASTEPASSPRLTESSPLPGIDKELIDALVRIASDNSVTLDWIILRAIKVYVQEYGKTGKL